MVLTYWAGGERGLRPHRDRHRLRVGWIQSTRCELSLVIFKITPLERQFIQSSNALRRDSVSAWRYVCMSIFKSWCPI